MRGLSTTRSKDKGSLANSVAKEATNMVILIVFVSHLEVFDKYRHKAYWNYLCLVKLVVDRRIKFKYFRLI
jgi:hypothetical protein